MISDECRENGENYHRESGAKGEKMADVVITIKIMPESPDIDLKEIEQKATVLIADFGGEVGKVEIEPIAFGLNALKLIFVMDEKIGSTEELELKIENIHGVKSVEVVDVRRAVG